VNRDNVVTTVLSGAVKLRDACFAVTMLRVRVDCMVAGGEEDE
jgi:hypothetical protein